MAFDPMKKLPGGVQGHIMAAIIKRLPKEAFAAEERRELYPDKPWLWEAENITKTIVPESGDHVQAGWAIAFLLNAFAWVPIAVAHHNNFLSEYPWSQALILLPIAALLTLPWAIHRTLQAKIFSDARLCLENFPVVSGTTLDGNISVTAPLHLGDRVKLTLTCHESIRTGSGKSKQTKTKALWSNTQSLTWSREVHTAAIQIPVHFALPQEMEGTTEPDTLFQSTPRKIYWTLLVTAAIRGINLRALFKLPIYRTSDSPPLPPPDYAHVTWQSMEAKLSRVGIYHVESVNGHHVLRTRVPRSYGGVVSSVVILAIIGVAAYRASAYPDGSFPKQLFQENFVVQFLVLSIVAGAIRGFLYATRIEISPEGLELRAGIVGFRRARFFALEHIASLDTGYDEATSSGKHCDIQLHTIQGQKAKLLSRLPDRSVAEELIALLMATLAVQTPKGRNDA